MKPGDRLRFDGKSTSWLVRAVTTDERYAVATCSLFGAVHYTATDHIEGSRGPLNVVGGGMGVFSTRGPDEGVDDAIRLLESGGGWGVSHRNRVRLNTTGHEPRAGTYRS